MTDEPEVPEVTDPTEVTDVTATAATPETPESPEVESAVLPRWVPLSAWFALLVVVVLLAGPVGALVAVAVAAVALARLPLRIIGGLGVASLFGALVAVLVGGVPSPSEISPAFVSRSLVPHHLTFAGVVLVSVWVVLDLYPHLSRRGDAPSPPDADPPPAPVSTRVGVVLVVVAAVGALAACMAVLQA